ncbi:hypothetical protein LCGC14_1013070 [marine sediment metagenome]|uniref:RNA polymerase sigma-70 region 2 domain-containing protein n=1 Tax=marine sediment metagenome TaxID=412755 RepID=A0A0F9R5T9_9ZZZZ
MRTNAITANQYEQYKNTIYRKAISYHITTGLDVDDFVSIGNEAFCKCLTKFDGERGANFNTYLFISLDSAFRTYLNVSKVQKDREQILTDIFTVDNWDIVNSKLQLAKGIIKLEGDPRLIVMTALYTLDLDVHKPRKSRGLLKNYLRQHEGWSWSRIQQGFRDVASSLYN